MVAIAIITYMLVGSIVNLVVKYIPPELEIKIGKLISNKYKTVDSEKFNKENHCCPVYFSKKRKLNRRWVASYSRQVS